MADHIPIETPDFPAIEHETGPFTMAGLQRIWLYLTTQNIRNRKDTQISKDRLEPLAVVKAQTGSMDNFAIGNASVVQFTGSSAGNLTGMTPPETAKSRIVIITNTGSAIITLKHESGSSTATNRFHLAAGGDYLLAPDQSIIVVYESSRWRGAASSDGQGWTAVAYASGNFTANNAMTWTVDSGDQTTLAYRLVGKTLTVAFTIATSTVGGVPSTFLQITIPGGFVAAKEVWNALGITLDSGVGIGAGVGVQAGGTLMLLRKFDGTNWTASVNTTYTYGEIIFEVQ